MFRKGSLLLKGVIPGGAGGFPGGMAGMGMPMPGGMTGGMTIEMMKQLQSAMMQEQAGSGTSELPRPVPGMMMGNMPGGMMDISKIIDQAKQMAQQGGGAGGPKMGVYMMGHGVNEKGKRVARMSKMVQDADGNIEKDFMEKQLDPDDPVLSASPWSDTDSAKAEKELDTNTIELDLNDDENGSRASSRDANESNSSNDSSGTVEVIPEAEIVFERALPDDPKK